MQNQIDNLDVISAVCRQLEDNGYKPNQITAIYGDLPDKLKNQEDGFNNEDVVCFIMENGKFSLRLFNDK